jgi:proliferating cell nuclear antigen
MERIIEIRTVQSKVIKTLVDLLREILPEGNIEINSGGVKILATDPSKTMLIHLKLEASKFDYFLCKEKKILGMDMNKFQKIMKTMSDNDTLTLFYEKSDHDEEKLGIEIANGDKNKLSIFKMKLMDIDENKFQVPPAEFDSIITMPSDEFQKICRDMHVFNTLVEIKNIGKQLIFNCTGGESADCTVIMSEIGSNDNANNEKGLTFVKNAQPSDVVQGFYDLKSLTLFTKCTNVSNIIEIFMKNDFPLLLQYKIGTLGTLKLGIAPKIQKDSE